MSYLDELFSLRGKTAIITGGGRGIGQVVALGLSKAYADIVILSRSDASQTIKLINDNGGKCCHIKCDVTDENAVNNAKPTTNLFMILGFAFINLAKTVRKII